MKMPNRIRDYNSNSKDSQRIMPLNARCFDKLMSQSCCQMYIESQNPETNKKEKKNRLILNVCVGAVASIHTNAIERDRVYAVDSSVSAAMFFQTVLQG